MEINRRRAPSSSISKEKKLGGHRRENEYAMLIGGKTIAGTGKGDVIDHSNALHSVKSGKKWQIFLYGYNRISGCRYLNVLKACLDAFPENYDRYVQDRTECIAWKENYISKHGRDAAKLLPNKDVINHLGSNTYIEAKERLAKNTSAVREALKDRGFLRNFLSEAIFNNEEVSYLAIKDSTYQKDNMFKVFDKNDVLDLLSSILHPSVSQAGRVPEDYNVAGQKTLLCYPKGNGRRKNLVEIEIRNDSAVHYRQVRFNMYSKDALHLLLNRVPTIEEKVFRERVVAFGLAINAGFLKTFR